MTYKKNRTTALPLEETRLHHEQLEFKFMAEIQKPEQMEFAFAHIEEGMDK